MNRISIAATTLLLLAACDKASDSADKAAATDGAPAAPAPAQAITFQPGQWQQTSELTKMEVPGMPPEMAKANLGQKTTFEHCMTPEEASKPKSDFFTNADKTTDCKTKNFAMLGGKIDATMTCVDKNVPGEMTMTMKGDYKPTEYQATMTMVRTDGPGGHEMKITAVSSGKRIGDCDAKDGVKG